MTALESKSDRESPFFLAAAGLVLSLAFAVRLRDCGTTLFEDEVWVAALLRRGGLEPHTYSVPPLFYFLQRIWTRIQGFSDPSLRALPLFFGTLLAGLPFLSSRTQKVKLAWSALLAFSSPLLFYSTRLKQYTLEACAVTILLLLFLRAYEHEGNSRWGAFFATAAASVLTLHASVFFITSAGLVTIATKRTRRWGLIAGFAAVAACFIGAYAGYLAPGPKTPMLHGDLDQWFILTGRWTDSPAALFANSVHWSGHAMNLVRFWWLVVPAAMVLWLLRKRDWTIAALSGLPIVLVIVASVLHRYPYGEVRLMIFCLPGVYLAVAEALAALTRRTHLAMLAIVPFLVSGVAWSPYNSYMGIDDLRSVVRTIREGHRAGVPIYADSSYAAPLAWYLPEVAADLHVETVARPVAPGWYVQKNLDLGGRSHGMVLRTDSTITVLVDE